MESDAFDGWHGGPTVSESYVPLIFAMPGDSFVNGEGEAESIPQKLRDGFNNGATTNIKDENGYLRNWHLTPLLQSIITEFRE